MEVSAGSDRPAVLPASCYDRCRGTQKKGYVASQRRGQLVKFPREPVVSGRHIEEMSESNKGSSGITRSPAKSGPYGDTLLDPDMDSASSHTIGIAKRQKRFSNQILSTAHGSTAPNRASRCSRSPDDKMIGKRNHLEQRNQLMITVRHSVENI
jgi:hypothetical protein